MDRIKAALADLRAATANHATLLDADIEADVSGLDMDRFYRAADGLADVAALAFCRYTEARRTHARKAAAAKTAAHAAARAAAGRPAGARA